MNATDQELDTLLGELERTMARTARGGRDAIDDVLGGPRRQSAVTSVRHHEAVDAFRRELTDGLIRSDTANQLLRLVTALLARIA